MIGNRFTYYGYERDTFFDCIGMIRSTNRRHILLLNTWFLLVNLLYLFFSIMNLFGVTQERAWFYIVYLFLSIVFDVILGFFPRFSEKYSIPFVYISMFLMLSYGIFTSMAQPYMPATMFLVLLAISTLSYIDNMWRMLFMVIFSAGMFLVSSFMLKTFSIAYHDAYNVSIVVTLAIGLHYTFQRMRVQQFILYQKDLQIQRELEVKSSFDTLTSLLNRGRFFSIAEEILRHSNGEYMAICLLDLDGFKERPFPNADHIRFDDANGRISAGVRFGFGVLLGHGARKQSECRIRTEAINQNLSGIGEQQGPGGNGEDQHNREQYAERFLGEP